MRKKTKPTSTTVCPNFDDDVIAEILLRLPAKSLLRFRCVSKSWLALISEHSFVQNHLRRVNANNDHFNVILGTHPSKATVLSTVDDKGDVAITELDYPVDWCHYDFMFPRFYGSCNGLVCLEFENGDMIVWNPCTREFKQLPQPELHIDENGGDNYVYLAGFGYDSTIADYKVIRATSIYNTEPVKLQVLTLKSGEWRTVQDFNHIGEGTRAWGYNCNQETHGFLLNETIHWVSILNGTKYSEAGIFGIVTFGLADETCQVMSVFPYSCSLNHRYIPPTSLVAVGNSLLVYHEFGIYRMEEYGVQESWTKVMSISPEDLPDVPSDLDYYSLRPISMLENGEALVNHRGSVGIYNPDEKTFRYVLSDFNDYYSSNASYVETLVSPVVGIGVGESEMASTVKNNDRFCFYRIRKETKLKKKVLSLKLPTLQNWCKKGRRGTRQIGKARAASPND